ncbi:chemoreceptor glutamine deamidase CheD [Pararhizobium antarcticum]|uniref:Probable chemoreceptor glutamine deamidase CheD n=1 Tax=Pararhizobium antarcticum TaxID=1798805 RepID=A0A657LRI1_9HYPH|nr:chemoreceptor glutamine deamidase CheD [Pararhizobium antarcticum]OJF94266.1 chemotaxis protein CheD [Rhizobium sp. 58]OJF96292.1 chemotaxis protein CheD [Pararhizobium antarcticum]
MIQEAAVKRLHVIQGEFKVVSDPDVVLSTILGSCVSACMRDPVAGVGGMNHFLLPGSAEAMASGGDATRYGVHLMELLINGLLKKGARRERLEAKIFGGAKTIARFSNVGEQNALFARQFLMDERIQIVGESTGGEHGRKLEYWPLSGRARQYALTGVETQKTVALEQRPAPVSRPVENTIEFF